MSAQHTPPHGIVSVAAMSRAIDAAAKRASSPHDVASVKIAREMVRAYDAGTVDYIDAAKAVVALEQIATRVESASAIHLEASAQPGVYFARSRRNPRIHYRTTSDSCTCEARVLCAHSKAVLALHAKAIVAAAGGDPFARIARSETERAERAAKGWGR